MPVQELIDHFIPLETHIEEDLYSEVEHNFETDYDRENIVYRAHAFKNWILKKDEIANIQTKVLNNLKILRPDQSEESH